MELDPDFSEFLAYCDAREVRYLVVGGYALAAHGHPRFTKDLDVGCYSTRRTPTGSYGPSPTSVSPLTASDFSASDVVVQLGRAPKRIDLLTSIDGVDFSQCWSDRLVIEVNGRQVPFLSRHHLVTNKRASGRLQDLADVEALDDGDTNEP